MRSAADGRRRNTVDRDAAEDAAALACLVPHIGAGPDFGEGAELADEAGLIGDVVVTGVGGFLLGWIFVRWGFSLWPAIVAPAGLNALWGFFDLGENAIGGWTGNALRLGVIAAAIGLTLVMAPKKA